MDKIADNITGNILSLPEMTAAEAEKLGYEARITTVFDHEVSGYAALIQWVRVLSCPVTISDTALKTLNRVDMAKLLRSTANDATEKLKQEASRYRC